MIHGNIYIYKVNQNKLTENRHVKSQEKQCKLAEEEEEEEETYNKAQQHRYRLTLIAHKQKMKED